MRNVRQEDGYTIPLFDALGCEEVGYPIRSILDLCKRPGGIVENRIHIIRIIARSVI